MIQSWHIDWVISHTYTHMYIYWSSHGTHVNDPRQLITIYFAKSPINPQKSSIRVQKSPIHPQKTPHKCKTNLYIHARSLRTAPVYVANLQHFITNLQHESAPFCVSNLPNSMTNVQHESAKFLWRICSILSRICNTSLHHFMTNLQHCTTQHSRSLRICTIPWLYVCIDIYIKLYLYVSGHTPHEKLHGIRRVSNPATREDLAARTWGVFQKAVSICNGAHI